RLAAIGDAEILVEEGHAAERAAWPLRRPACRLAVPGSDDGVDLGIDLFGARPGAGEEFGRARLAGAHGPGEPDGRSGEVVCEMHGAPEGGRSVGLRRV